MPNTFLKMLEIFEGNKKTYFKHKAQYSVVTDMKYIIIECVFLLRVSFYHMFQLSL